MANIDLYLRVREDPMQTYTPENVMKTRKVAGAGLAAAVFNAEVGIASAQSYGGSSGTGTSGGTMR